MHIGKHSSSRKGLDAPVPTKIKNHHIHLFFWLPITPLVACGHGAIGFDPRPLGTKSMRIAARPLRPLASPCLLLLSISIYPTSFMHISFSPI